MNVGLYLNANMDVTNLNFGSSAQLVSSEIILFLNALNFIGDKNAALTYSVFGLDSTLHTNRAYYTSNTRLHNPGTLLATTTTSFVNYLNRTVLRIPINSAFATQVLTNPQYLVSNAAFQQQYKGFYIAADCGTSEGILYEVDLAEVTSGFYLRYKTSSTATDTLEFKFHFANTNATAVRFNTVKYQPLPAISAQLNGDTTQGTNKTYLKGMGGSRIRVQIPYLKSYVDSFPVAVSRAEVVFKVDPAFLSIVNNKSGSSYRLPSKLTLLASDSLGRETSVLDQQNSTYVGRYDGNYDNNGSYIFNIPLHAQAILKGKKKNYGFYLVMADPTPPNFLRRDANFEAVIFQGSSQTLKPVLNISYIKFPHE
jgi:hypothetical protein